MNGNLIQRKRFFPAITADSLLGLYPTQNAWSSKVLITAHDSQAGTLKYEVESWNVREALAASFQEEACPVRVRE
jgi:hypothetical protein